MRVPQIAVHTGDIHSGANLMASNRDGAQVNRPYPRSAASSTRWRTFSGPAQQQASANWKGREKLIGSMRAPDTIDADASFVANNTEWAARCWGAG